MVQQSYGNSGANLSSEYHERQHYAYTETFSIVEWGDIDITRYELDSITFDRKYKDSSYITESQIETEGSSQGQKDIQEHTPQRD
jgi:hypothetical protein